MLFQNLCKSKQFQAILNAFEMEIIQIMSVYDRRLEYKIKFTFMDRWV